MAKRGVLRITRPYETEDDYLAAEGTTIDRRSMLLVGAPDHPKDSVIRVELSLANGERLIRAEVLVAGLEAATETTPEGLRVRFKRIDSQTKAFIGRATSGEASSPNATSPPRISVPAASRASRVSITNIEAPPNREELLQKLRDRLA